MIKLETREIVEISVLIVLNIIYYLLETFNILSEQAIETFGVSLVAFIWIFILVNLYRWGKTIRGWFTN